jgi:hypothetical protein
LIELPEAVWTRLQAQQGELPSMEISSNGCHRIGKPGALLTSPDPESTHHNGAGSVNVNQFARIVLDISASTALTARVELNRKSLSNFPFRSTLT